MVTVLLIYGGLGFCAGALISLLSKHIIGFASDHDPGCSTMRWLSSFGIALWFLYGMFVAFGFLAETHQHSLHPLHLVSSVFALIGYAAPRIGAFLLRAPRAY